MKVLFITRKYPPSKGGMEKISYGVISNFPELKNAEVISWGRSQKWLFLFIPWTFLKSFYLLSFKRIDLIHLGDSALSFMGCILKKIFNVPIVVTAHGLDLTYKNRLYQLMIKKTLKELDKIVCVSTATKDIVVSRGIKPEKAVVIHDGIDVSEWPLSGNKMDLKKKLEEKTQLNLKGKFLLISVGRLVERKGVNWFIENVFPKLGKNCLFFIVGMGKEEQKIRNAINSLNLQGRVMLLGKISDELLKLIYNSADVFIMPNIPIEGDVEGFGIVAIEAASCGLPVVAANLEGIRDAIKEGKNGFLIKPYDTKAYIKKINEIMKMKDLKGFMKKQISYTHKNYDLKNISCKYYSLFKEILKK